MMKSELILYPLKVHSTVHASVVRSFKFCDPASQESAGWSLETAGLRGQNTRITVLCLRPFCPHSKPSVFWVLKYLTWTERAVPISKPRYILMVVKKIHWRKIHEFEEISLTERYIGEDLIFDMNIYGHIL